MKKMVAGWRNDRSSAASQSRNLVTGKPGKDQSLKLGPLSELPFKKCQKQFSMLLIGILLQRLVEHQNSRMFSFDFLRGCSKSQAVRGYQTRLVTG